MKDVRPSQPTGERPPQAALEERELASVAIASGVGRNQERKEGVGAGGDRGWGKGRGHIFTPDPQPGSQEDWPARGS